MDEGLGMTSYFGLPTSDFSLPGEMAEWSNAAVSKTVVPLSQDRGFEPPSLRQSKNIPSTKLGDFYFQMAEPCLHERGPYENKKTLRVKRAREYIGFEAPPSGLGEANPPLSAKVKIFPQRSWGIFIFHMAEPCLH